MTDLDMIKEFRRDTPQITETAAATARTRLGNEWLAPAPRRRIPRLVTRAALAGALTVTIAAGITVAQNLGDPHHGAVLPGTPIANAAALGDRAARAAEKAPYQKPRPDQWNYTRVRTAQYVGDMNTWWLGMDAKNLQDIERWERVDGGALAFIGRGGGLQVLDRAPDVTRPGKPGGPVAMGITPSDHGKYDDTDLPTEPAALLRRLYERQFPNQVGATTAGSVYEHIAYLLQQPLTPQVRAALYRALPQISGVTVRPDVTDAAGRHGIAFSCASEDWEQKMIILDPVTFRYLGTSSYATRDHVRSKGEGTLKAGTLTNLTAVLEQRIVDKPGQRP